MIKESVLKFLKLDSLVQNLTGYVETKVELMKLEIKEDLAKGLSRVAVFIVLAFTFVLFIVFFSVAVAFKLGESMGTFGGFAVVAGFYLLLAIVTFLSRENIFNKLEKELGELMTKKKK
ncbi:phage holin family protein [Ohtaekwangia koreensis]|uniref:Putative Holin-X, holin superfamily III n=1 Tax=Ohtaekwangia koreensis TaxID=688867 RepID=A0A1T5LLH5_9BACT|nr:phage holin family protein [Ohtaekwangia koreensis]SKC76847.1 Putative Holin-X, holin superfamily III [Ohtaekwangia koreensis]